MELIDLEWVIARALAKAHDSDRPQDWYEDARVVTSLLQWHSREHRYLGTDPSFCAFCGKNPRDLCHQEIYTLVDEQER